MTDRQPQQRVEQATFGAGCFWGAEAAFRALPGVVDSRVGFARSAQGEADMIEVVQVDFDPGLTSYSQLVGHFWALHDPTSVDRQGTDIGVNYRSALFVSNLAQAELAQAAKHYLEASGKLSKPVATVILPFGDFQLADQDQQRYLEKHGLGSCSL